MMVVTVAVTVASLVAIACGSSSSTLGPLTLQPPQGWYVTDREADQIKVTNGTIADENSTEPGTATAVFDVYVRSTQTVAEFRKALKENNVDPLEERIDVGGYDAVRVSYPTSFFGPSTEVVFVPEWEVRMIYRAAFPSDESAYTRNRTAFRRAVTSISFSGRPPDRA